MRPSFLLGALSLVLMVLTTTDAAHCTTWSTSHAEIDTDPLDTGLVPREYVDNDLCQPECIFSIWFYEESNGIPGLQRGDEVKDDTCHGMIEADTIWCGLLPMALLTPRRTGKDRRANGAALAGVALLTATAVLPTADAC